MKITKREFLKKDTWVNKGSRTIITSDIVWVENVGEVHYGFNMKEHMGKTEFGKAMGAEDPGDYILENYPADGTWLSDRLERLSIDEAYEKVTGEEGWKSVSCREDHDFTYEVALQYPDYGYMHSYPKAYGARDGEEALVMASLADGGAETRDAFRHEPMEELAHPDEWTYLDRSEHEARNVYLYTGGAKLERLD